MTEYNAGKARATWEIDFGPARREIAAYRQELLALQQAQQAAGQARGSQTVVPRGEAPAARPVGSGSGRNAPDPAAQAQRAEAAILRQARAEATLASAQGNGAKAAEILSNALAKVDRSSIAAIGAETQLTRVNRQLDGSMAVLPRTIAGLSHEAASFAVNAITMGGAVSAATAIISSFGEAFKFKAEMDASKASINVLLQGVRDSNQVWSEGAAYAQRYKLTQEELTTALSASTGIMRSSTAPTEQILNVMQRLTVLNPKENIEGAAFALKELQSGDINSIAERFNISRKAANTMKAEILAGGDAVKILDTYLSGIGVTSEALSAKLDGPMGKMKELAQQQEELKLAQGEFAMGPGLKLLEIQTNATRGAVRLFSGDWQAMQQSFSDSFDANSTTSVLLSQTARDANQAAAAAAAATDPIRQAAAAEQERAAANQASAAAAFNNVNASNAQQLATQQATEAANADAIAKLTEAANTDILKTKNAELEAAIRAAAAGSDSAGAAAANLAATYEGVNVPALIKLIGLLREKAALEGAPTVATANNARIQQEHGDDAATRAAKLRAQYEKDTRDAITRSTGSTAQRLALVREELKTAPQYSDRRRQLLVEEAQLTQQLASERTRSSTSAAKAEAKAAKAQDQQIEQARRAQEQIEERTKQHYEKLRQMQEDYTLSASRKQEDFEIEKQRLLAEGKIKEAQLLEEAYNRDKKRAAEDEAIARRREGDQAQQDISKAQADLAKTSPQAQAAALTQQKTIPGAAGGYGAGAPGAAQAQAALAATAMQQPRPIQLQVQIAPTTVQVGPEQIVTVTWPLLSQLVDAQLSSDIMAVALTAPPTGGQGAGVGGPTP